MVSEHTAKLSEYGIGTQLRRHNCLNCGRFVPLVPEGWEICEYPENTGEKRFCDYEAFEYRIQAHDCNTGTIIERLIKRRKA